MDTPPLLSPLQPKKRQRPWATATLIGSIVLIVVFGLYLGIRSIVTSGITKGPDAMFGDQHLKTAVALIELHKVRNGRYPEALGQLQFTGQWDAIALQNVRYVLAEDGKSYFVEVERGWIGKPELTLPPDFWRGTGYNPKLAPAKP